MDLIIVESNQVLSSHSQQVIVQLWHGSTRLDGTLIGTTSIRKLKGSTKEVIQYPVTFYWDTRKIHGSQVNFKNNDIS